MTATREASNGLNNRRGSNGPEVTGDAIEGAANPALCASAASPQAASGTAFGVYVPLWKRAGGFKPERNSKGRKRLPLDPVEYSFQEMGCKLGVTIKHSFLVSYEKEDLSEEEATDATSSATAADAEADAQNSESGDEAQFPQGKAVLRAVISFTGANPPSVDSKARLVWTRHRIDLIKANIGQAYPFFQGHLKAGRKMYEAYTYEGRFRIESVELATKNEVLEFIKARKISKRKRPAASWMEKLEAQWCKVLLIRCPEEEQTGNPLEQ